MALFLKNNHKSLLSTSRPLISSSLIFNLVYKSHFSSSTSVESSAVTGSLTSWETTLLEKFYSLIDDHHRSNTEYNNNTPAVDFTKNYTIPSLTKTFSSISPTPLSPSLLYHLVRRCSAPRHGAPFPQALSLFNWWVSSSTATSDVVPSATLTEPFNAMIDFAGKRQLFNLAWSLLDEMRDRGIPVTLETFARIIRRYVRAGFPSDATKAFARMDEYGCPPTPIAFSVILSALSRNRCAADAQAFFDEVKIKFPPDVVVYTNLIHAWCRAYKIEEAERVFMEMKSNQIVPNVYTYTIVINALSQAGQINKAHEVFVQMIDSGCEPEAATFNCMLKVHVKAGRTDKALEIFNRMKQMGCKPDTFTYNYIIDVHCRHENLDAALQCLNNMVSKEIPPNVYSFNPILNCVMKLGDVKSAQKVYARMREVKCKPNTVTYNTLMQLFAKSQSTDMVLKLKKEMEEEEGVEANVNTYKVLITMFCEMGHWNRAHQLLVEMVEVKNLKPTGPISEMVLERLRRAKQLKKHKEMVEKLVKRGFLTQNHHQNRQDLHPL
ncbi:Pentatricopeptide repeat-containing protein [Zostera marina]|uniref:Pentatricopeptide repeat-containing protein n=1 Tax=Zostera marina TaxID=29655 RepID=A0A0K9Q1D6_ZOSMR|nr:Pentatricopeptide repeat-containing protein [Zostera marina]